MQNEKLESTPLNASCFPPQHAPHQRPPAEDVAYELRSLREHLQRLTDDNQVRL